MDRNKVETAMGYVDEARKNMPPGNTRGLLALASYALELALARIDNPDADPGDECECEGCKTTEPAPHEAYPPEPTSVDDDYAPGFWRAVDAAADQLFVRVDDNGNTSISTVDDYEIRLKAWKFAYDFAWESVDNEFDATLSAATKLYNFLSGQNEDVT